MSSNILPKFEASIYFLPPGIHPKFHDLYSYTSPHYIAADSYERSLKKVELFDPNSKLRNVLCHYMITKQEQHPNGYSYTASTATGFAHPEISTGEFLKILKCTNPANKSSLEVTQQCWNRIFPGSLSSFNTSVPADDLAPEVRENLRKYYPGEYL